MKELFLVLLGFLLGQVPPWHARKRRMKTHWSALRAEIDQCQEKAETLLRDNIMSPLYRLPVMTYQASFPVLLVDGAVEQSEVLAIGRFFGLAQEINRGLDSADQISKAGDSQRLMQEFNRNCLKARELIEPKDGATSLYTKVRGIIDSKITPRAWQIRHLSIFQCRGTRKSK